MTTFQQFFSAQRGVSSQFRRLLCIFRVGGTLEHLPPDGLSTLELFEWQRRLAASRDPVERFRTLWVGALLGERLTRCSDRQIGDLLSMVQDGLALFGPEFAVCEHARRRLPRSSTQLRHRHWRTVRDAGVELLNAEAALFRSGIPHMLLPFQRNRFRSNAFLVPSAAEARACLLRAGFRSVPQKDAVFVESQAHRPIRLVDAGQGK